MSKINKPYQSKYSGEEIDLRLKQVEDKVDKVPGKGLSSNDFTDELKEKLEAVSDKHPYISLERLRRYLYRVTFDSLPEDNGSGAPVIGGCSSYVKDGKLYRNLDYNYDNAASFIVRAKDFEGMSFITGLNDSALNDELIAQLPYRIVDGRNNYGIKVSAHVLFNDWDWVGCGNKSINLTRLPFLVLSKVRSMSTLAQDLAGVLENLYASVGLLNTGYLIQVLVTDGTTTSVIMPPTEEGLPYEIADITSNPKLANFRWVNRTQVDRQDMDLQKRPTGVERFNAMPCSLRSLRFTKAYEEPVRLSEFIGLRGTTKDSTDSELLPIYTAARALYLDRKRDGQTWHTMHSVVYSGRMESLFIQEDWSDNCAGYAGSGSAVEHGTKEYWASRIGYVPEEGAIIVYDDYGKITVDDKEVLVPAIKIGTGNAFVQDLAFVGDVESKAILEHIENSSAHVSEEDRRKWDNKISVDDDHEVIGETLEFIK